jgi:hypothetical protein
MCSQSVSRASLLIWAVLYVISIVLRQVYDTDILFNLMFLLFGGCLGTIHGFIVGGFAPIATLNNGL